MTFDSLIDDLREQTYQVTVYTSGERTEIETWLANHGVSVESRSLPKTGPDPFIEIEVDDEVVGTIGIAAIEGLLKPPIRRPDRSEVSAGYHVLFEIFDRTVFSGMNRRELLTVSREIEDRAFRVGEGTLRVCFQKLSAFKSQIEVYRTLGTETNLNIQIHGVGDWIPPEITGITYHTEDSASFSPYWVLAFDGGPDETQACGLVAEEHSDEYVGFWTNDATTVENITAIFNSV